MTRCITFNGAAAKRPRKGMALSAIEFGVLPSMGPRPNGRGKTPPGPVGLALKGRLQWGRGQTAAESSANAITA